MKKIYVTFGQTHRHEIQGIVYDKDCVAVLEAKNHFEGRMLVNELFDGMFYTTYCEDTWDDDYRLAYFPRGYINLDAMLALKIITEKLTV